jgi:hypothetical protein
MRQRSVRTCGRRAKLAGAKKFESSNNVGDRLWTQNHPERRMTDS